MEDTIQQFLTKLQNEWAPAALDLGIRMTWYNALNHIIQGFMAAGLFSVCLLVFLRVGRELDDLDRGESMTVAQFIRVALSAIAGIISIFWFIGSSVLYPWTWIALFDPKVALAYDIYTKIIK